MIKSTNQSPNPDPSALIDAKISALDDWRGETLAHLRSLIKKADPDIVEAVKWQKPSNPSGAPVWEHDGIVCTGETCRDKAKLTFAWPLSGRVEAGRPPGKRPCSKSWRAFGRKTGVHFC